MTRRFQFNLKALMLVYAVGILVSGLGIAALGFGGAVFSATAADVLAERISPTMSAEEARMATYEFLEWRDRRMQAAILVIGIAIALTSIPLFFAVKEAE